jgi:hypothetical protein
VFVNQDMKKRLELLIDGAVMGLTVRKCYICEVCFFDCSVGMTVVDLSRCVRFVCSQSQIVVRVHSAVLLSHG